MTEKEFQLKKYQSESDQDFLARLLWELLNLKKGSNAHLGAVNQEEKARHGEIVQYSLDNLGQGEEAQKILEEIKKVIEEKDIDLSEVVSGLKDVDSSIQKGSSGVNEKLGNFLSEIPETKTILQEIAQSVKENKPTDVVFDEVISAQKKSTSILGELLSKLTGELKKKEYPKSMSIDGPVDVLKPKWWKEFTFSWAPLEKLFEKLKSHTFSVKVENQTQIDPKIFKNLPDEVAKKLSQVLGESLPKIRISGGGGGNNPFTFLEGGALKVGSTGGAEASAFTSSVPTEITLTLANTAYKLPESELDGRKAILIYNISDTDIYIGDASVTTSNGMLVMSGNYMRETIGSGLYACCADAGKKVRILELK